MDTTNTQALTTPNIGAIGETLWRHAHNATVYCQTILPAIDPESWKPNVLAYSPCWAMLQPGMELEAHRHATPEFYVFTSGSGMMRLANDWFPVRAGIAVNILPNVEHSAKVDAAASQPLIWVSIAFVE